MYLTPKYQRINWFGLISIFSTTLVFIDQLLFCRLGRFVFCFQIDTCYNPECWLDQLTTTPCVTENSLSSFSRDRHSWSPRCSNVRLSVANHGQTERSHSAKSEWKNRRRHLVSLFLFLVFNTDPDLLLHDTSSPCKIVQIFGRDFLSLLLNWKDLALCLPRDFLLETPWRIIIPNPNVNSHSLWSWLPKKVWTFHLVYHGHFFYQMGKVYWCCNRRSLCGAP
jgi:hypothetical protein